MRYNGQIRYTTQGKSQLNEYGELEDEQDEWSDYLPCSIMTNSDTRKGKYEDGQFRQSSFTILTELLTSPYSITRVQINREGENLGEYQIQSVENIPSQNRTKIVV